MVIKKKMQQNPAGYLPKESLKQWCKSITVGNIILALSVSWSI
jgi:hypothetical protein